MTRNIVFDMGNVLLYFDPDYFIRKLGFEGPEKELLKSAVFESPEWTALDWGRQTEMDALIAIRARLPQHLHEAAERLVMMWDRPILEVPGMYELIEELKQRGYGIYLLSNASLRQHDYWPRIPASRFFDGTIVSADFGCVKPYPELYRVLFRKYSLKPEECFFIDDRPENIAGGEALGMPGFVFRNDVTALRNELTEGGIL